MRAGIVVAAAGLVFAARSLAAQGAPGLSGAAPYYGAMLVGVSTSSSNRAGSALALALHRRVRGALGAGGELQLHALDEQAAVYEPWCPAPCGAGPSRYAAERLLVGAATMELFAERRRVGGFLLAGAGPAVFLTRPQPSQSAQWSLALVGGAGFSLPIGPLRLRANLRILQLLSPGAAPTQVGMLGAGLQL